MATKNQKNSVMFDLTTFRSNKLKQCLLHCIQQYKFDQAGKQNFKFTLLLPNDINKLNILLNVMRNVLLNTMHSV